jgi:uncharacterized protein YndB with AHSA1/START domain
MIDVTEQINRAERRVGTRTLAAGEARTVTISRVYDTTVDDLWDACTSPERIPRWFLPVEGDLRLGGRYAFQGNASGTIERCEPPHRLDATWEFGGQTSWVEVRITPEGERARFTLAHVAHVSDELWAQYGPGAVGLGWDGAVLGLTLHLEGGERPEDPIAWQTSDEGREFYTLASAHWARASIAAGTAESEARAAEERVTGFYTATA